MDVSLAARLPAYAAVVNANSYHTSRDALEPGWREATGAERDLLQGLIQYAAAAHHVRGGNREGATGLAASALEYLDGVDDRGVDLAPIRAWLRTVGDDYDAVEGRRPPAVDLDGDRPVLADLGYPEAAVAAPLVAEATGYDEDVLAAGAAYALDDLAAEEVGSPFVTLVLDFLEGERRAVIVQRLGQHVQRRRAREDDVAGLFD
jgi:hypothetical protein